MTVKEMLGRMDSREVAEWRAFFLLRQKESKEQELAAKAEANLAKMMRNK